MTSTVYQATPTKLRNGDWGAKVSSADVTEGDILEITTRGGKRWDAEVSHVVWKNDQVAIVATVKKVRFTFKPNVLSTAAVERIRLQQGV